MVQSKIDKTINYPETKKLEDEDRDYDADLFEISRFDNDCIIAVGQMKFTFIEKNVVYFPVYIIKDERVDSQIGVYEILSDQQPMIMDEDGDLDVDKLGELLTYSFVNASYIKGDENPTVEEGEEEDPDKEDGDEEEDDEEEEDEDEGEEEEEEEEDDGDAPYGFSPLQKQNMEQAERERNAYKKVARGDWVANYLRNNNFKIVDNEGGGDCLFATIRDGLARAGITTTVAELREKLANEANEDIYQGYKNLYNMAKSEYEDSTRLLKELGKQHREIKKRAEKSSTSRDEKLTLIDKAKEVQKNHKRIGHERRQAQALMNEYSFMKGVDNLEQFKEAVKKCSFWGETWAISTLERVLNIKLILLSRESFKAGDIDNVLLCGQLNDNILQDRGSFEPTHYIISEFQGYHYTLVTYKSRGALTFDELPFDIKKLIVDKCMERQAGPYYLIPDFRSFMGSINVVSPQVSPQGEIIDEDGDEEDIMAANDLYDDSTVFQFYSRSANQSPGKGSGEKLKASDRAKYAELASIPDWRKSYLIFGLSHSN